MKAKSIAIVILAISMVVFSQIAYFWEYEPYFVDLGNFIDSLLTLLYAVVICLFTLKPKERCKSEPERKLAESKLKYSAFGLLFIDFVLSVSYIAILYGS